MKVSEAIIYDCTTTWGMQQQNNLSLCRAHNFFHEYGHASLWGVQHTFSGLENTMLKIDLSFDDGIWDCRP